MDGADRSAAGVNTVPVRPVRMTDMGFGGNRCELNGDQQDRRPKNPQKCAGQSHNEYYHTVGVNGTRDANAVNTWSQP